MNLIKRAFGLANKNIILLCDIILFYCLTGVYTFVVKYQGLEDNLFAVIVYGVMMIAFFAGFFNVIKYIINNKQGKMRFLEGVGEYFLPMFGIGLLSLILYTVPLLFGLFAIGKAFGGLGPVTDFLNNLYAGQTAVDTIVKNTDPNVILQAVLLLFAMWLICMLVSFVLLYWIPVVYIGGKKNIFTSLYSSIVFLFKKFWVTLLVSVVAVVVVSVISVCETLTMGIPVVSALFNILSLYITIVFLLSIFIIYKDALQDPENKI